MGLEKLTIKEFKKYKTIISFLAKFDITIDDLIELKNIKNELKNNANLTKQEKANDLEKAKQQNELDAKIKSQTIPTAQEVMVALISNAEKEGFYPNGKHS